MRLKHRRHSRFWEACNFSMKLWRCSFLLISYCGSSRILLKRSCSWLASNLSMQEQNNLLHAELSIKIAFRSIIIKQALEISPVRISRPGCCCSLSHSHTASIATSRGTSAAPADWNRCVPLGRGSACGNLQIIWEILNSFHDCSKVSFVNDALLEAVDGRSGGSCAKF